MFQGLSLFPSSGSDVDHTFVAWTRGKEELHGFLQRLNNICRYSTFSVDVGQKKQGTIFRKYLGEQKPGRISGTPCVQKPHKYGPLTSRES
jgi:hypothetical protein